MSLISFPQIRKPTDNSTGRLRRWVQAHRLSLCVLLPVLALVAIVSTINFDGFPGRVNDDEGTYVAQAWAILYRGELAHYTYWYDHPWLGWMQIAGYAWLTSGFDRAATAVTVGREFMILMQVLSCGLIYLLARRLQFHRVAGIAAVLLFSFSPVALYYHRMVFLDNIAITWTLAALVFAASPRRSLAASFGSAVCFAGAVLTKETALVMLPAVLWLLYQHQPKVNRGWSTGIFVSTFGGISLFYPLYAVLKNELLEGPGHVSLVWALKWQLFEREGTGSVFDAGSVSHATARWWLEADPWLLIAGAILVPVGLFARRLRPIALALGIQLAMLARDGYLPQPYVIALIPFAALLIAGVGDMAWKLQLFTSVRRYSSALLARTWHYARSGISRVGVVLVVAAAIAFGFLAIPGWAEEFKRSATYNPSVYSAEATRWVQQHVGKDEVVITDDNIWADLVMEGYTKPIWLYKADLDPEVKATLLPGGYTDIKYLVLPDLSEPLLKSLPTIWAAIEQADVIKVIGEGDARMIVRKVRPVP